MIREEYNKELENQKNNKKDKPEVSTFRMSKKEIRKRQELGDRGYIGKTIMNYADIKKSVTFSTVFTYVIFAICFAMYLIVYLYDKKTTTSFIIISVVFVVLTIWILSWFLIVRPLMTKKTNRLKKELDDMMYAERQKQLLRAERMKRNIQ